MDPPHLLPERHRHDALQHRRRAQVSALDLAEPPGRATAPGMDRSSEILTPEALTFVAGMHRRFDGRRQELLARSEEQQQAFDAGALPDFLPETASIRAGDWPGAPLPG